MMQILNVQAGKADDDSARPTPSQWQTVTLPDEWNRRHPDYDGGSIWYRIDWQCDRSGPMGGQIALLVQSVVMAGEIFVNEHLLFSDEHLTEPLSRSWNMPRRWVLPDVWLHSGLNTLFVRVVGTGGGQPVGLGPVFLGDPQQIQQRYDDLRWHYRTLFEINLIVSGVIGVLFFCIWIIRRDQSFYGWYALSSLFWVAFIANILVTSPWPFPNSLMVARANTMALLLSVACFCLFTWRFGGQVVPRIERALWIVTITLLAMLVLAPDAWTGKIQRTGFLVASVTFQINCLHFLIHAWRSRQTEHALLAVCLLVVPIAGLHDALVITNLIQSKPIFPYANVAITLSLSAIIGLRHARNLRRIEHFNEELADGVERARSELAKTLDREYALALANTRLNDRLQVAHDLHDGLGGSLVHMMASVEQGAGPLQRPQVLSMLKFIRDDLRHTIDSNSSAGVTVPATPQEWIAPLRHRFTTLFDELDIASEWQFPPTWREMPNALQYLAMTRLVEEALTNVIKHSRARHVRLRLDQPEAAALLLRIEDDGVGFDVAAVRQADISIGMRSMSVRIARVGGTLDVTSRPGETVLAAQLKLEESSPV
ncbi:sensor histidine kinase [Pseudaminobacter soli (ex Li et al. 2025)]|uniref:Histidine kinase n=1 Tax=Pseudaminobacter soli (ex Li et al. 2025) TaxID=1295366 RepID=A0A2P7S1V6_9HYPH|nr:7TM diverse intracellular signaling domain-containing protein [Mesorhizobium soli]PSJ56454.1 histidine kinase [Mesorhizobium soli]